MRFTTSALVMAAAIGVSAKPTVHLHHAHLTAEEIGLPANITDFVPLETRANRIPFCNGRTSKRDKQERGDVGYVGNTGVPGLYGCNMMVVDASIAGLYDYTATIKNSRNVEQQCICWNKIGPDGGINGFFNGNQAIKFQVPAGQSKVVAIDTDSQGGCACGAPTVPLSPYGQFASTWLEFDMGSKPNGGWSGADASALVPAAYGMNINPLQVCDRGICSTINQGGSGTNAYTPGTDGVDGLGLNLTPGQVRLAVTVG
ncbi:Fc.00g056850.m01.CDS01 [Cosmosporella sp. VM-42]